MKSSYKQHEIGDKVKYPDEEGKQKVGIVMGVQNHESPEGFITARFYIIDTGGTVREDVVAIDKKGKATEVVRQPEQITIAESQVKAV